MKAEVEERRVAIEAMATLANLKDTMIELILKPAGVPQTVYEPVLSRRDLATGRRISKRKAAPLILDELDKIPDGHLVITSIVRIASEWDRYHLAADEYAARATVQKAREVLGSLERSEKLALEELEQAQRRKSHESDALRREQLRLERASLLSTYDQSMLSEDPQQRGYLLEGLLTRVFDLSNIPVYRSFSRNHGGEQIDGAFQFEGWYYLIECRWRQKLADIRELDGLRGLIGRSGRQTMGLFLSINGWSPHVVPLLRQNPEKTILLMDGYDLRLVLDGQIELQELLHKKIAKLNLEGEPYLGVQDCLLRP